MRARQDEDKGEAPARLSIDNCGWDPGKDEVEDGLSDCETVFACPDYDDDWSTFDDGINVPGLADASNHRGWDPGQDFWRSPRHREEAPPDGLSACETFRACPACGGDVGAVEDAPRAATSTSRLSAGPATTTTRPS